MHLVSLFFVFLLVSVNSLNAQNYFTGDYTENDIKREKQDDFSKKNFPEKQKSANYQMSNKSDAVKKEAEKNDNVKKDYQNDKTESQITKSANNLSKKNENEVSPELKDLPPIPLDGNGTFGNEEIYNPKDINLSRPVNREAKFFMNEKKWDANSDAGVDMPEKEKGIYIEYIPSKLRILVGGLRECRFGIKVENYSGYKLRRMRLKFIWRNPEPDPETGEYRERSKDLTYTDIENGETQPYYSRQPGQTLCNDYASVKFPKVKVESCIMEGKVMSQLQCAKMIRLRK